MRGIVAGLTTCVLVAACGTDAGIIVAVEKADDFQGEVHELEFVVGVAMPSDSTNFVKDESEPNHIANVAGRDLDSDDRYTLLLRDGRRNGDASTIAVAVIARDANGTPIGFGALQTPQRFLAGKVLQKIVILENALECTNFEMTATGCVLPDPDSFGYAFDITTAGDPTCDGVSRCQIDCPEDGSGAAVCYDGGDEVGTGICRAGIAICTDGVPSECIGQVLPRDQELCNGLDDDCDGLIDEDPDVPDRVCGVGACRGVATGCGDCNQADPLSVNIDDCESTAGIDDDCDGAIDEDCADCVPVAVNGSDTNGSLTTPFATIAVAAEFAELNGVDMLCVASVAQDCTGPLLDPLPSFDVPEGFNVVGGYNASNFEPCPVDTLGERTVVDLVPGAPIEMGHSSSLSRFDIRPVNPEAGNHTGIRVNGATDVHLGRLIVFGQIGLNDTGPESHGIGAESGAEVEVVKSRISGGAAGVRSVGIKASSSVLRLVDNCDSVSNGRCQLACDGEDLLGVFGHIPISGQPTSLRSIGVELDGATGSQISRSMICGQSAAEVSRGVFTRGDATGVVMATTSVSAEGSGDSVAFEALDCAGSGPWLLSNRELLGTINVDGAGIAIGIQAVNDCALAVENTDFVRAQNLRTGGEAVGIECDQSSPCAIDRNAGIMRGGVTGTDTVQIGIRCRNDSCALIHDNLIAPFGKGDSFGMKIETAGPVIAKNTIHGGCSPGRTGTGIHSFNGSARIENNLITGANCPSVGDALFRGVGLSIFSDQASRETDVHSNFIDSGLLGVLTCEATAVELNTNLIGENSLFRNNIFRVNDCAISDGFVELDASADPRSLRNNCFDPTDASQLYVDGDNGPTNDVNDINGEDPAGGNVVADPLYIDYPGDVHLLAGSMCRDAGTTIDAPVDGLDGNLRDGSPDIGPYENP